MATAYIYKIYCPKGDKCYIGSTTQPIKRRWNWHVGAHRNNTGHCSSKSIFDEYGVENCTYEVIETVKWTVKSDYHSREQYWIKMNPSSVNIMNPSPTKEEKLERGRVNTAKWEDLHKDPVQCDCGLTYLPKHKARHFKTMRHINGTKAHKYDELNPVTTVESIPEPIIEKPVKVKKERISAETKTAQHNARCAKYYAKHKEAVAARAAVKVQCECGSMVAKAGYSRHLISKIHQNYLSSQ